MIAAIPTLYWKDIIMCALRQRVSRFARILGFWIVFAPLLGCGESLPTPAASGSPPAATAEAPPEGTIKAMLEKDMWGPPEQGGTRHTYNYRSLKIASPREGNYLTDGVPANKPTMVFPVKVSVEVVRTFTDGTSKQEVKDQSYVFFKDEFGDWTYRFIQNN